MKHTLFCTRFYWIAAAMIAAVVTWGTAFCQQRSELRRSCGSTSFFWLEDCTEVPILHYRNSSGHFGERIADSDLKTIFIWKDGTIAWEIAPKDKPATESRWYHSTVPAEKVEAAVQAITNDFAKYPSQNRERRSGIFFRLDPQYSPSIGVYSSQHYEHLWVDFRLWKFYKENREVLQSDDNEAILNTIKGIGGFPPGRINPDGTYTGLHPAFMFDCKGLVEYYREKQPNAGLSEKRTPDYSNEEILKAVEFYVADVGHLLLMEEKILELLPSTEGLEPEKIHSKSLLPHLSPEGKVALGITQESRFYIMHNFIIEREVKDGQEEFFYSRKLSESERIEQELREFREKKAEEEKAAATEAVRKIAIEKVNEVRGANKHLEYDITVKEEETRWIVHFEGKIPMVGNHMSVTISKETGEVRFAGGR